MYADQTTDDSWLGGDEVSGKCDDIGYDSRCFNPNVEYRNSAAGRRDLMARPLLEPRKKKPSSDSSSDTGKKIRRVIILTNGLESHDGTGC